MILVLGVGFHRCEDGVDANESCDVIDMSVSVIAGTSTIQPDHLFDAEIFSEGLLQLLAAHAWIALLHIAQEALFGGEQDALAVGVDRSALQYQPLRLSIGEGHGWLKAL